MQASRNTDNSKLTKAYMWTTICAGGLVYFAAAYRMDLRIVDLQLAVLTFITVFISSRITIKILQFRSQISVSDTFIFLTLILISGLPCAATERPLKRPD